MQIPNAIAAAAWQAMTDQLSDHARCCFAQKLLIARTIH
jgi:hypothetical protein